VTRKNRTIVAWLSSTVIIGTFLGALVLPNIKMYYSLMNSNDSADAEVLEVYPGSHDTCKYHFSVGSRQFNNTGNSCGHISVGSKLIVYYSPSNPEVSTTNIPRAGFMNEIISYLLALIILPLFAAAANYWKFW
jgi:hypothetical protein